MKKYFLTLVLATSAMATDHGLETKSHAPRQSVQTMKKDMDQLQKDMGVNAKNFQEIQKKTALIRKLKEEKVNQPHLKERIDARVKELEAEKKQLQENARKFQEEMNQRAEAVRQQAEALAPQQTTVKKPSFFRKLADWFYAPIQWLFS